MAILQENDDALKVTDDAVCTNHTKHIDVRYPFVREKLANQTVTNVHVESEKQAADDFTKNLSEAALVHKRKTLLNK